MKVSDRMSICNLRVYGIWYHEILHMRKIFTIKSCHSKASFIKTTLNSVVVAISFIIKYNS